MLHNEFKLPSYLIPQWIMNVESSKKSISPWPTQHQLLVVRYKAMHLHGLSPEILRFPSF